MNASVVYSSMTGHSKKLALAIAEELDITAYNVKLEAPEIKNTDVVFIVSGIYDGVASKQLMDFIDNPEPYQVKAVALVMSSTTQDYSKCQIKRELEKKNIPIAGEFSCSGSFLVIKLGHPNKEEIKQAVEFARQIYNQYI